MFEKLSRQILLIATTGKRTEGWLKSWLQWSCYTLGVVAPENVTSVRGSTILPRVPLAAVLTTLPKW